MSVELALIGHVGFAEDHTPFGSEVSLGGSGYACARGATVTNPEKVGLVALVGDDFNTNALNKLGINLEGVESTSGPSARFSIIQNQDGSRSWEGELGVASGTYSEILPHEYLDAHHFHLGTMPLEQQKSFIHKIRWMAPHATISVDMFEQTATENPIKARELGHLVDLIFLNNVEYQLLYGKSVPPPRAMVVKEGPAGAYYRSSDGARSEQVTAPHVQAVDTTGAGELVVGVFLSLREAGMPVRDALHYSVRVASAKVTEFGVDGRSVDNALHGAREAVRKFKQSTPPHQNR
jgi:sugar/nucleoside kinase (ribokinase family)